MIKYCIGTNLIGIPEYIEHFKVVENSVYKHYNQAANKIGKFRFKNFNNKYK